MNRLTGEDDGSTVMNVEGLRLTDMGGESEEKEEEDEDSIAEVGDEDEVITEGIDDVHERRVIASHESGTDIKEFGNLNERLVDWDKGCFCGEVGHLKDSGIETPMVSMGEARGGRSAADHIGNEGDNSWIYSPRVNAVGIREGSTPMSTQVPEKYDRSLICSLNGYAGRELVREAQGVG